MRYLLDSNSVNALADKRESLFSKAKEAIRRGDRLGTCEAVVSELFFGMEFSSTRDVNILRLNRTLAQLTSWPYDRPAALQCAQIMADLKRRGLPIQSTDIICAAIARSLGNTTVVSTDTDFLRIPGLRVEIWME